MPGHGIQVASLLDVAATKLATIQQRAQARDYEDLAAIVDAGVSLSEALAAATATYGSEFNGAQPKAHSAHRSQNRCKWAGRRASPRGARRLSRATLCEHLNGQITIGIYALNPRTQRSKWVAIDADYVGLAFLAAGGSKLAGAPAMVAMFAKIGFGQWFRILTGLLEVGGAIGLFVPRFAVYAASMLAVVMVSAIGFHLTRLGGNPVPPIVLLLLATLIVG